MENKQLKAEPSSEVTAFLYGRKLTLFEILSVSVLL